ncbi:MAG TPA: serine/threonine-protein kinase [Bryobacteraceae bacterium]|jgi:serine/threonine protein kinase|nr:serine/threonine-protein kinase [Bryobacteraceae bacterium]
MRKEVLFGAWKGYQYELKERLTDGEGGMGITYRAEQIEPPSKIELIAKVPKFDSTVDSPDRIIQLNIGLAREIRLHENLRGLSCVAQLVDTSIRKENAARANIYQFVPGLSLEKWCAEYARQKGKKQFSGILDAKVWFELATRLTNVVAQVHSKKVVHGDLWARNVIMRHTIARSSLADQPLDPVVIDFGWGLRRDEVERADRSVWYPHWPPERATRGSIKPRWYAPVDIYSLGMLLFELAAGRHQLIPFSDYEPANKRGGFLIKSTALRDTESIKDEIRTVLKRRNPKFYHQVPGITELIMFCVRPLVSSRADHAGIVQQQLEVLTPGHREIEKPNEVAVALRRLQTSVINLTKQDVHPLFTELLLHDIDRFERSIQCAAQRAVERRGERDDLILDLTACMRTLAKGDAVRALATLSFFDSQNIGPTGRFTASLIAAAKRAADIDLILISPKKRSKSEQELLEKVVRNQRARFKDFGNLPSYTFRLSEVDEAQYREFVEQEGSFLLVSKEQEILVVEADYLVSRGKLAALRYGVVKAVVDPQIDRCKKIFEQYKAASSVIAGKHAKKPRSERARGA